MPDPIEAVRANRAELLEIVGDLFFDRTVPTRKSAAARPDPASPCRAG
jgi:hypothetical protein